MLNDLSILKDVDEIDHITVHYRRDKKPLNGEEAVRVIKKDTAVYESVKNIDLGFNPLFMNKNDFSEKELFDALVKIRETLMSEINLSQTE